jgi:uncharacterized FlaG/YvyC family protein
MASDGIPVNIPVTRLVHGGRAQTSETVQNPSGKSLPHGGGQSPPVNTEQQGVRASKAPDAQALVAQLNKRLNDSGQPTQFRLNSSSGRNMIQEINPASGEVVGEYPESEFPILAQGLSVSGLLVNTLA